MRRRLLVGGLKFAITLIVVAAAAGFYVFWRAMPAYSGSATLPGLSSEVRVWRDAHGVPHIFASSMDDAARALGYVHASERLFQMEMNRRVGQGRVAEILGPDFVRVDRYMRTLGYYREAQASFEALSPSAQNRLVAYAGGVNVFLDSHRSALPPEFLLIGDKPEPWTPADSLVWGKVMAQQLSHNYPLEALRARLKERLGPERASWLFPGTPAGAPISTLPVLSESHASRDKIEDEIGALTGLAHAASNEWVVSGSRTVTGKPILANDPHLGLEAPILWYLVRIVTPDLSLKGATFPGAPIVAIGQNDSIAWGFTTANTDTQDLFIETADPSDPSRYLTPDGPKPFETREETIHVKGAADVKLNVRGTRHGPVLSDVSDSVRRIASNGHVVALAFTGLSSRDTTAEAFLRLNAARDWNTFLDAMRLYQTPTQNVVYADRSGDIGFFSPGLVPLRKSGDGLAPVDGASGAFDWVGTVPFDELPQLHNPAAGFAFNANNANVPDDHEPTFGRDWDEGFRARRIQEFFDTIKTHSLETSAAMQADHLSLAAKDLQPFIATIAPSGERARQAQAMLLAWNAVMDKDRPEPLIFAAFLKSLRRILLAEKIGDPVDELGPFAAAPLISLMREHVPWCDGPNEPDPGCRKALGRALDEGLALLVKRDGADMSAWRWGHEQVSLLRHKVFAHVPLLDRLSDLSVPSSGGAYTLDRGGGDAPADQPFARTHGPGFRGLFDLSDPDNSRFIITTGQSGHIFSRHYGDLVALWNDVKSFTLAGSEDDLRKSGARELILSP